MKVLGGTLKDVTGLWRTRKDWEEQERILKVLKGLERTWKDLKGIGGTWKDLGGLEMTWKLRVWQTDRQTDKVTTREACASKNKPCSEFLQSCQLHCSEVSALPNYLDPSFHCCSDFGLTAGFVGQSVGRYLVEEGGENWKLSWLVCLTWTG